MSFFEQVLEGSWTASWIVLWLSWGYLARPKLYPGTKLQHFCHIFKNAGIRYGRSLGLPLDGILAHFGVLWAPKWEPEIITIKSKTRSNKLHCFIDFRTGFGVPLGPELKPKSHLLKINVQTPAWEPGSQRVRGEGPEVPPAYLFKWKCLRTPRLRGGCLFKEPYEALINAFRPH